VGRTFEALARFIMANMIRRKAQIIVKRVVGFDKESISRRVGMPESSSRFNGIFAGHNG
jgi:hypothetical protein